MKDILREIKENKWDRGILFILAYFALKVGVFIRATNIEYNRFFIFLITYGIGVFIFLALEFSRIKHKRKFILGLYAIFSFIFFADVMHFSYFESLASVSLFKQVSQVGAITDSIKMVMSLGSILLLADLPFLIYYFRKKGEEVEEYRGVKPILASLGILVLGSFIYMGAVGRFTSLQNQEFYTYHVGDIRRTIFNDIEMNERDQEVLADLRAQMDQQGQGEYFGQAQGKNLMVIQVEALQNFVIGLEYKGQEITPNLNKFLKEEGSLYFDDYFQLIGRGNTSDAEFVTNNSLHPSMEEYTYMQYQDNQFYGLPQILREEGYTPWVFHGFEKEFWNREKAYKGQGFQRFLSQEDYDYEEVIGFGISDREFLDQTFDYIKELDEKDDNPFYSFIITLSSHTPYVMDEKYHVLDIEKDHQDTLVANYLQAVHYTDQCLGEFFDKLKEEGLYDETVIALYGDHFGVNNASEEVFQPMKDILGVKYSFDHIMNIPLIVHVPGLEETKTISTTGSQIDFYPTILNLLGIKNEKGLMFGKDLLNHKGYNFVPTQTIMRKGSFIDRDHIFIFSGDGIFENSRAIDRNTREEVDIEDLRPYYDKAIEEISLGNLVLKKDLLAQLLGADGDIDQLDLCGEEAGLGRSIKGYDNRAEDSFEEQLEKNQILRMNIEKLGWTEPKLAGFLRENPDYQLIVSSESKVKDESMSRYTRLKKADPDLMDRYIAEIHSFDDYFYVQRDGYHQLILNTVGQDYSNEEIIDFLSSNQHVAVILEEKRARGKLVKQLQKIGVAAYVEMGRDLERVY